MINLMVCDLFVFLNIKNNPKANCLFHTAGPGAGFTLGFGVCYEDCGGGTWWLMMDLEKSADGMVMQKLQLFHVPVLLPLKAWWQICWCLFWWFVGGFGVFSVTPSFCSNSLGTSRALSLTAVLSLSAEMLFKLKLCNLEIQWTVS